MAPKQKAPRWKRGAQSRISYTYYTTAREGLQKNYGAPDATSYYMTAVEKLACANAEGWASALCPFHNDHNPSLSVNCINGAFKCFSCGAKGGNVIAFHAKLHFNDDWHAARRDLVGGRGRW